MKAKDFNGNIKTYRRLPKTWEDESGLHLNFNKISNPESFGFYNVVKPTYDSLSQRLGAIEFDSVNSVFTYPVIDIDFTSTYEVSTPILDENGDAVLDENGDATYSVTTESTYKIDELKSNKKREVNEEAGRLLKPTDWYVIRKAERGIDIPTDAVAERLDVITKANVFVSAIDALTTYEAVLRYTFNYSPTDNPIT
jgi:hypothetical protein